MCFWACVLLCFRKPICFFLAGSGVLKLTPDFLLSYVCRFCYYFNMPDSSRRIGFLERLLTREERVALAFVVGVGFFGLGILAWQKGASPSPVEAPRWESVRINQARIEELIALPGIGSKTAQRIMEERRRNGRYLTLKDLTRVRGIGERTLQRLKGLVRFD